METASNEGFKHLHTEDLGCISITLEEHWRCPEPLFIRSGVIQGDGYHNFPRSKGFWKVVLGKQRNRPETGESRDFCRLTKAETGLDFCTAS
jgi:hypothetical protein